MMEELQFPLNFDHCPNCGSTKRLAETVAKQEKEKGKISEDTHVVMVSYQTLVADPRKMILTVPIISTFVDICADCGTLYCVHAELGMASPSMPYPKSGVPPFGGGRG